jgi:hypothetical protein
VNDPLEADSARGFSIVVPIGPTERAWNGLIHDLTSRFPEAEIVLATCVPLADAPPGTIVVPGSPGRAAQQNRGAEAARGNWLWFLHADTIVTPLIPPVLRAFLAGPADRIGYFRLGFQTDGPRLVRLNALGANFRARWLGLPFGDQGFVVPRPVWDRLGGFDEGFGLGEDLELVVRARARGVRLAPLAAPLLTSARRYRDGGWLATTIRHVRLTADQVHRARARNQSPEAERTLAR